ncbi:type IX secretion system membrane protein PorP/SprF [Maribellus luteus]|uniref:Type IX secretion system membrane protein PorP/SprF n=1 Tax=Maribellus luteus TaxID=2305463 RepID=A0A399SUV5_9BACT|nr:PorP/SprF family type IX secretion system membrane protein [Maribellus luteus]RIJ47168.1 type IX secretion system membrane protein PorP/SprF [Maribellus luteus]
MEKNKRILFFSGIMLLCCGLLVSQQAKAQDVPMHTQGLLLQEFLNPAYNSFKENVSISLYNRAQWGNKFRYSPETYVGNIFLPIRKTRLGANIKVIVEDIGLRNTTEFNAGFCHNISISEKIHLALGYSVGFLQSSFNENEIICYPDEDLSFLLAQSDLNRVYPTTSVGLYLYSDIWHLGLSSMTASFGKDKDDSQYFPGFDFALGTKFKLSPSIEFRPEFILKYYNEKSYSSNNGVIVKTATVPMVYDLAANFILRDKVWLGTSHRFGQAQTFILDLKVLNNMKVGYIFELGIGDGLNQFNSHGLRLAYEIMNLKSHKKEVKSESTASRINSAKYKSTASIAF